MKISHTLNPYHAVSDFKESRLLFVDGGGGGKGEGSQSGDSDEPDPNTPQGKKWAALRQKAKENAEALEKEREARLKAEAKAEAIEELKKSFGLDAAKEKSTQKAQSTEDTDDMQINPEDEKYVGKIFEKQMKRLGLDKVPEVVQALQQNTQELQASTALERAKQELTAEFADSVPFDYSAALAHAKEKGYGRIGDAREALKLAHEDLNRDAFIEFYRGGQKSKKQVPKMAHSGRNTGDEIIDLDNEKDESPDISSFEDARALARKTWDGEV